MSQLREQPLYQCLCPRDFTGKAYTNHVEVCTSFPFKYSNIRMLDLKKKMV